VNISFSPRAARDLEEIGDYIARDNPLRAVSFLNELMETCGKIAAAPLSFEARPNIGPNIRRAVHGRYLIFYTVQPSAVRVERILHGARDLGRTMF
jgi:toxin ParE1/3/4